jgi:hypothetical protein
MLYNTHRRLMLALSKGPNRVGVSLLPSEDKQIQFPTRYVFQYLEFRTMDKVHKRSNSDCYKPSSEPCRFSSEIRLTGKVCFDFRIVNVGRIGSDM